MDDTKIKILISYHKPSVLLKDDILTPIHVGRALATEASKEGGMSEEDYQWMLDNMIGDDTGNNISYLNKEFYELTAIYWAWKNYDKLGNPEYIGFMHYRRHLNFNVDKIYEEDQWGLINNEYLNDDYINKYNLKSDKIIEIVKDYDILVANKWDVSNAGSKDNYDHYKTSESKLKIEDYDKALEILNNHNGNIYLKDINSYNSSKYGYYTNIFIMKKEIFICYCNFLFSIIFDLNKSIDISNYTPEEARASAYISEWLFGIYLFNVIRTKNYKIKELQRTIVHNLDIAKEIKPKFKNSIKICFSSDNNYVKYLAVTINSIIMNSNKNYYYEIYILDNNIDNENKSRILAMSTNNIFICFININNYIINIDKNIFYIWGHFSISAYYRFFIPRIFYNFDRLLYLDCDLVVLDDLVDLYFSKKLDEKLMLVVHDSIVYLNNQIKEYNSEYWNDYLLNKLKLKNIDNYFQSGVLLFNIKKCFDFNLEEKALEKLKIIENPLYLDQCILNATCENNIDYMDLDYNVEWFIPIYLNINNINKYKNSKDYYENL